MGVDRFDVAIRAFAQVTGRRMAARRLLGVAFIVGAVQARIDEGLTKRKKKRKKKCKGGQQKCGKTCIPADECCGGCGIDEACCDGSCVDLATDGANCGVCGHACPSGGCAFGACTCGIGTVCPGDCECVRLAAGGLVCLAANSQGDSCSVDVDCPPGSLCPFGAVASFCSEICRG